MLIGMTGADLAPFVEVVVQSPRESERNTAYSPAADDERAIDLQYLNSIIRGPLARTQQSELTRA